MAIFGNNNVETTEDSSSAFPRLVKFTAPENGTVTSMSVRIVTSFGAADIHAAIYADNAGAPGALRARSSTPTAGGGAGTWCDITMDTAVISLDIVSGTVYWLAWWASNANKSYAYTTGTTNQFSRPNIVPTYPTWDDPFGSAIQADSLYSIYATYTPSGGGLGKLILRTPA